MGGIIETVLPSKGGMDWEDVGIPSKGKSIYKILYTLIIFQNSQKVLEVEKENLINGNIAKNFMVRNRNF